MSKEVENKQEQRKKETEQENEVKTSETHKKPVEKEKRYFFLTKIQWLVFLCYVVFFLIFIVIAYNVNNKTTNDNDTNEDVKVSEDLTNDDLIEQAVGDIGFTLNKVFFNGNMIVVGKTTLEDINKSSLSFDRDKFNELTSDLNSLETLSLEVSENEIIQLGIKDTDKNSLSDCVITAINYVYTNNGNPKSLSLNYASVTDGTDIESAKMFTGADYMESDEYVIFEQSMYGYTYKMQMNKNTCNIDSFELTMSDNALSEEEIINKYRQAVLNDIENSGTEQEVSDTAVEEVPAAPEPESTQETE